MKAYLQQSNGLWFDDFVYISVAPLMNRGIEIIKFDDLNIDEFFEDRVFSKDDILIGSVESTEFFFKGVGVEIPKYIGYPEELKPWYGRMIYKTLYGDKPKEYPYFIKPAEGIKLFTGSLIENEKQLEILEHFMATSPLTDDTKVYISDPMEFVSEYRCFVRDGEFMGMKHYAGDFKIFPNVMHVDSIIKTYKNPPISYTIDIGVTEGGFTQIVEINDFWAIGSYGLDGDTYVNMIIRRFNEIVRNNNIGK
jgi:hypothetical protein